MAWNTRHPRGGKTIGSIAINPSLYEKMPYDLARDLAPVSQAANALNVLVVHPSLPARSVKEFVALAKARPGQLNYGSSGPGATDHLAGELFNAMTGNQCFELMPETPTMSEAGLKEFEVNNWYGLFAPAGTPKDVNARLHDEAAKALAASYVDSACSNPAS